MDELIDAVENGPMAQRIIERATAKGELKGKAEALLMLWKMRFGTVPQEVNVALNQADAARTETLLAAFATNKAEAELRALLGS